MIRVEYGPWAMETTVPLTPRERIRVRASLRRMSLALEKTQCQWLREFKRYLKTPEGERELIDRIVKNLKDRHG